MGTKKIPAGETVDVSENDGGNQYDLEAVEGAVRFGPRRRLAATGRKLREGSSVQVELEGDEGLFVFNDNTAEATIEVTTV